MPDGCCTAREPHYHTKDLWQRLCTRGDPWEQTWGSCSKDVNTYVSPHA
jgi:hypothetical protein